MSQLDEILGQLPIDQIAAQLGEDPAAVHDAAYALLPALVGGLEANAQDPNGAASLLGALDQHRDDVDVSSIDVADGERAARHIFGDQQDEVVQRLGSTGVGSGLVQKLLPMLIPIVLSVLAKKMSGAGSAAAPSSAGGDQLGSILSEILSGASQGSTTGSAGGSLPGMGSILGDLLGGVLGGGRR